MKYSALLLLAIALSASSLILSGCSRGSEDAAPEVAAESDPAAILPVVVELDPSEYRSPKVDSSDSSDYRGAEHAAELAAQSGSSSEPIVENCLISLINQVRIPAEEAGMVVKHHVKEGMAVTKGMEIVAIDDALPMRQKKVAETEENKARMEAENEVNIIYSQKAAEVAEVEYKKSAEANRRTPGAVPDIEIRRLFLTWERSALQVKQSIMEQDLAKATLSIKQEEVAATEDSITRRHIKSPIDGVVTHLFIQEGEWVREGDPVMRVIDMNRLRVQALLSIEDFAPQNVADRNVTVEIELTAGRIESFRGRVTVVHPEVTAGVYRVWAEVENRKDPSGLFVLMPGMKARMTIHLQSSASSPATTKMR
jgi:macrolide-specific efflux system membrane fusion protein